MKEFKLIPAHGGRYWDGTELQKLQSENLDILQAFFSEPLQAAVIQGIQVAGSNISAGLAVIKHADGWKVVRFAGDSGVTFPYYLQVTKSNTNAFYQDTTPQLALSDYTATHAAPGGTPATDIYLKITADGAVRWYDVAGRAASTAWESIVLSGGPFYAFTGDLKIRIAKLSGTVQLRGYLDINLTGGGGGADASWEEVTTGLATKYLPAADSYFPAMLKYDSPSNTLYTNMAGSDNLIQMSACLTAGGDIKLGVIRWDTGVVSSVRVFINAVIPLG